MFQQWYDKRWILTVGVWLALSGSLMFACSDDHKDTTAGDTSGTSNTSTSNSTTAPDTNVADTNIADTETDEDATEEDAAADTAPDASDEVDPNNPGLDRTPVQMGVDPAGTDVSAIPMVRQVRAGQVMAGRGGFAGIQVECAVGDYVLVNSVARFCVENETTSSNVFFGGGRLVDAEPVGVDPPLGEQGRERLDVASVFFIDLTSTSTEKVEVIRDGTDGPIAVVRVTGGWEPVMYLAGILGPFLFPPQDLSVVTEYRLKPDAAVLEIVTFVTNVGNGVASVGLGDMIFWGDTMRYTFPGYGLEGPRDEPVGLLAYGKGIAYGWFTEQPMSPISLPEVELPAVPLVLDTKRLETPEESQVLRRYMTVASEPMGVFKAAKAILPEHPALQGAFEVKFRALRGPVVGLPNAEIVVRPIEEDGLGEPVFAGFTDQNGRLSLWLEDKAHQVEIISAEDEQMSVGLESPSLMPEMEVSIPEGGALLINISERIDDTLVPTPAKFWIGNQASGQNNLHFLLDGRKQIHVPAGRWLWTASRGTEYSFATGTLDVRDGDSMTIQGEIERVLETPGFISGEFHQHSSPSLDSDTAVEDRVLSNIVEGVDFAVSTDHDTATDFGPVIEALGAQELIASMVGVEVSPLFGHFGMFPVEYRPNAQSRGGLPLAYKNNDGLQYYSNAEMLFAAMRGQSDDVLLQVNHPRGSTGYFNRYSWSGTEALDTANSGFATEFDLLEVFNGKRVSDTATVLRDWYTLLNVGKRVVAVGNSDTHSRTQESGFPRNYLPSNATSPTQIDDAMIMSGLRSGDVVVSGSGYMSFGPGAPGEEGAIRPGQLIEATSVEIDVRVVSPPWARLDRLIVVRNGQTVDVLEIGGEEGSIVDFDSTITLETDGTDAWFHFLACGGTAQVVYPGSPVFVMSNPHYLDADGNGTFDPPGVVEFGERDAVFCE